MSNTAIKVEKLSKMYRIGVQQPAGGLTNYVKKALALPLSYAYRALRSPQEEEILWALHDISFDVKHGEVVGIIGRNGAGKSTLLKILSSITEPTSGVARIYGRVGSLLEVGTGFNPELTGRENVYMNGAILGMRTYEINKKFDEIVNFADTEKFIDTPVKHYSSGMRMRLAFAVAAHLEPEILIIDEVLAVGDFSFQKKCIGKMEDIAHQGRTVLFVSHNMEAVLNLCSWSVVLSQGEVAFQGVTEEAVRHYYKLQTGTGHSTAEHILYDLPIENQTGDYQVTRIEVLDSTDNLKRSIYTWDDVKFRIYYSALEFQQKGSIILEIRDFRNQRLVVFDSGLKKQIQKGNHFVDCYIPKLSLSAGEYNIGVGLAISNAQWLWREENLAQLQIYGRDVFNIGRPPIASRMLFAIEHYWN